MKALAYWSLIFIVGFMSSIWAQSLSGAINRDLFIQVIPHALGSAMAFIVVPALLVVLPKKIYSSFKQQQYVPDRIFTSLLAGMMMFGFLSNAHRENEDFTFFPKGCEFRVNFPSEPEFYDYVLQEGTAHEINGEGAQYVSNDGVSFLKAECIVAPNILNEATFDDAKRQYMMDMVVQQMQLSNASFSQKLAEDFIVLNVDGFRMLDGREFKYRISNYISSDSNLTLYRVSTPKNINSSELERFGDSVVYMP